MTWDSHDYYTASDTHYISWAWNGTAWCVLLWDKEARKYTKRRFCPTDSDLERAIAAFKAVADDNHRSGPRAERSHSSAG